MGIPVSAGAQIKSSNNAASKPGKLGEARRNFGNFCFRRRRRRYLIFMLHTVDVELWHLRGTRPPTTAKQNFNKFCINIWVSQKKVFLL